MSMFRFIWAVLAVPTWLIVASLVPSLVDEALRWPVFGVSLLASTALVAWIDRRFGPPFPTRHLWPADLRWFGPALLAGVGFTIIGSEIGNIGLSVAGIPPRLDEDALSPSPFVSGVVWGLLYPACLVYVVHGVVQRALLWPGRPWAAVLIASLLGSMHAPPAAVLQWVFLLALPGWIILHTGSLLLAVAAFLPSSSLPLLEALDLAPGIAGFDVVADDRVLWQPIWFDLLGAALIAVGCMPLIGAFQGPLPPGGVDDDEPEAQP